MFLIVFVWLRTKFSTGGQSICTGSEQVPVGSEQVPVCLAHARCRFLQSANRLRTLSRGLCLACTRCSKLRACQAGSSRFRQKDFAFRPHQLEVPARFQKVPHVFHVVLIDLSQQMMYSSESTCIRGQTGQSVSLSKRFLKGPGDS